MKVAKITIEIYHIIKKLNTFVAKYIVVIEITKQLLLQLKDVLNQFKGEDYAESLDYLSGASFGKHVRHILDFYLCLIRSREEDVLCYDIRNRDLDIESNPVAATNLIDGIILELDTLDLDKKITLTQTFSEKTFEVESSNLRELSYNLEHTIHHMAILKIALNQSFSQVQVYKHFGVAFSTVSHRKSL